MNQTETKSQANEDFHYRVKNVEILTDGTDYVEYDHKLNKELVRRRATAAEKTAYSET